MRRDLVIILEMIEAGRRIARFIGDRDLAAFEADEAARDAVLWNFTVLGEAANQVSASLKAAHPDVAWSAPIRMRNRIVHGYWDVDLGILYTAARESIPSLIDRLRIIAGRFDSGGS